MTKTIKFAKATTLDRAVLPAGCSARRTVLVLKGKKIGSVKKLGREKTEIAGKEVWIRNLAVTLPDGTIVPAFRASGVRTGVQQNRRLRAIPAKRAA